jgi:hypothetical protein
MNLPDRRIGVFYIRSEMFDHNLDEVAWLLSKVIVIEAQYDLSMDAIKYTAICSAFMESPRFMMPYVYELAYRRVDVEPNYYRAELYGFMNPNGKGVITWGK